MATENEHLAPNEIIDLGTVVTDDLPQRFLGKAFLRQMNFTAQNGPTLSGGRSRSREEAFQARMHTTRCSIMADRT